MFLEKVFCRIDGGFGNQLFQYAAARSLADRLGVDLALDLRLLEINDSRKFELDRYQIRAEIATDKELAHLPNSRSTRLGRIFSNLSLAFPEFISYPIIWQRSVEYDLRFLKIKKPIFLVGYWQTEQYFYWNRFRLINDLQPNESLYSDNALRRCIEGTVSVALHIRRGDYISNSAAASVHGLCDKQYYTNAVQYMIDALKDIQLFIFSDDTEWVRGNLEFAVPCIIVDAQHGSSTLFDFEMMRSCKHHIISNSTYSWWAAWLAEHSNQIVIAPKQWFKNKALNAQDLVPARWVRLHAEG